MEVNVYIIKSQKNTKGKAPLRIHVGSYIKIPLKISISVDNWNESKQRVKTTEDFYFKYNERIEAKIKLVNEYLASTQNPTKEDIQKLIDQDDKKEEPKKDMKPDKAALFKYLDEFIERQKVIKSSGYVRNLKAVTDALREFNGKLTFDDINKVTIEKFVKYLIGKDKQNATIEVYIRRLKLMLKDAAESGIKINRSFKDLSYRSGKYKHVRLTWEEVDKIEKVEISKELGFVRDAFIFRCNTGVRDSDYDNISHWSFMKKKGKMYLRFNSQKTGEDQYIILNSKAIEIAEKYSFEMTKFTQQYFNRAIKVIGKAAEVNDNIEKVRHVGKNRVVVVKPKWDMISTHTARRTFARRWYDLGGDIRVISHFLNHKNEAQTREYIGLDDDDTNDEMIRVFDQGEIFK